jgi:uncharacterized protein (DUF1501 family)
MSSGPKKKNRGINAIGCAEFRRGLAEMDRRSFMRAGMLGAMGLTMSDLLRLEARAALAGKLAKRPTSVIILYMRGGPSQLETFDMKPDAPAEFRGEFAPISTSVPGLQVCELLPMTARVMHKFSVIRSLHHRKEDGNSDHTLGDHINFTGYPSRKNDDNNTYSPSIGSIVAKQMQPLNPKLPAYVMIPKIIPGTDSAYLGPACRPFETLADPATPGPFKVQNMQPPEGLSMGRIDDRRALLHDLDQLRRDVDRTGMIDAMDKFQQQAWGIVTSPEARNAFDLDAEPAAVRQRYGFMSPFKSRVRAGGDTPAWSQRVLLARRLVEAGVRLVTVDLRWWDTHEDNFYSLKNSFLPRFDQAYSALIEDLDQRGLLETTMVLAWGEHGRTPRVNSMAGRDHWGNAFCAAMAGGGIQGGRMIGSTDDKASEPKDNPKIPHDVLATLYRHLGVDTTMTYPDQTGRPVAILPAGAPITELF